MKIITTALCVLTALAINAIISSAFEQQVPTVYLHLRVNLERDGLVARRAELQAEDAVIRVPRDIDGITGKDGVDGDLDATRDPETWPSATGREGIGNDAELDSTQWLGDEWLDPSLDALSGGRNSVKVR